VKRTRGAIVAVLSGVTVLASGTVGFGLGRDGGRAGRALTATEGRAPEGTVAAASAATATATAPPAPAGVATGRAVAGYPGADVASLPPFPAQALEADGVHAVGVAYRQTDDPDAKPGQDLVRQAFDDATRQARELADAAGVKLGRLVALSEVKQTQPFYKACVTPLAGRKAEASPPRDTPTILPAPAPGSPPECSPEWHVVAWVFVRYELA
jgi:hypothetical protein